MKTGRAKWRATLQLAKPRYTSLVAADDKVFYAWEGVLCFEATPERYNVLFEAKVDARGVMDTTASFRKKLNMDQLELTAEGQKQAERLWRKTFGKAGPLQCSSPAIADGRIYFRFQNGVACYDLRKK